MSNKRVNNLRNLNKYIIEVIQKILSNENICKLLVNKNVAPLQTPLKDDFDKQDLMWNSVFPYKFIPDAEEYESCFIMVDFDDFNPSRRNKAITQGYLLIDILCHENLLKMLGGTRTNELMGEINDMINGANIGVGTITFSRMRQWHRQPRQYIGYTLAYAINDINEWY